MKGWNAFQVQTHQIYYTSTESMKEKENHTIELEPQPETITGEKGGKSLKIGLVGNYADTEETRFLLTPEGADC